MSRRVTLFLAALGFVVPLTIGAYAVFIVADAAPAHPYKNVSSSMSPTLLEGDRVTVQEFTVLDPLALRRGVIVAHRYPPDRSKQFIKRLIGVPGDTLGMQDGRLSLNGRLLAEPYAWIEDPGVDPAPDDFRWQRPYLTASQPRDTSRYRPSRNNWGPLVLPAKKYFVLGDNRDNSLDSRYFGFLDESDIFGLVRRVYFSRDSLGHIRWSRLARQVQ